MNNGSLSLFVINIKEHHVFITNRGINVTEEEKRKSDEAYELRIRHLGYGGKGDEVFRSAIRNGVFWHLHKVRFFLTH